MEKYVGFYTSKPFWMGKAPDLSKFGAHYYITPEFYDVMAEIIFDFRKNEYGVSICKDGMIMLSKSISDEVELKEKWKNYLGVLNSIYLLLESSVLKMQKYAFFDISEITNKDAFGIELEDGKMRSQSIPAFSYAEKYVNGRFLSDYKLEGDKWFLFDNRLSFRLEINEDVLDEFNSALELLFVSDNAYNLEILSDLTKSVGEYKVLNFETSLVLAWFIIEKYIDLFWNRLLKLDQEIFYKERIKSLEDSRTYTAAVRLEILQFNGFISIEELKKMNEIRSVRNKIVHQNKKRICNEGHCALAFDVIKTFIKKEIGIDLEINTGYSLNGI